MISWIRKLLGLDHQHNGEKLLLQETARRQRLVEYELRQIELRIRGKQ